MALSGSFLYDLFALFQFLIYLFLYFCFGFIYLRFEFFTASSTGVSPSAPKQVPATLGLVVVPVTS